MPKLTWDKIPPGLRKHVIERVAERVSSGDRRKAVVDFIRFRVWVAGEPDVPEGEWWIDFDSFKVEGVGVTKITGLAPHMHARGQQIFPATAPVASFGDVTASVQEQIDAFLASLDTD